MDRLESFIVDTFRADRSFPGHSGRIGVLRRDVLAHIALLQIDIENAVAVNLTDEDQTAGRFLLTDDTVLAQIDYRINEKSSFDCSSRVVRVSDIHQIQIMSSSDIFMENEEIRMYPDAKVFAKGGEVISLMGNKSLGSSGNPVLNRLIASLR